MAKNVFLKFNSQKLFQKKRFFFSSLTNSSCSFFFYILSGYNYYSLNRILFYFTCFLLLILSFDNNFVEGYSICMWHAVATLAKNKTTHWLFTPRFYYSPVRKISTSDFGKINQIFGTDLGVVKKITKNSSDYGASGHLAISFSAQNVSGTLTHSSMISQKLVASPCNILSIYDFQGNPKDQYCFFRPYILATNPISLQKLHALNTDCFYRYVHIMNLKLTNPVAYVAFEKDVLWLSAKAFKLNWGPTTRRIQYEVFCDSFLMKNSPGFLPPAASSLWQHTVKLLP